MTVHRWLALIVAAHALLGVVYAQATPPFEAPDEGFHVAVIHWINSGRGLPVQQPETPSDYEQEGSQPPLYYLVGSALTWWMPTNDWEQVFVRNPRTMNGYAGAVHNVNMFRPAPPTASGQTAQMVAVLRGYSLLLSCITVVLAFALARQVWPSGPKAEALVLFATALVAFNPKAIFINASANNDNLLSVLSTAVLLLCVQTLNGQVLTRRRQFLLGVLLGLAALTKISGLVVWPIVLLTLLKLAFRSEPRKNFDFRFLVLSGLLVFGSALLVSGWWYVRNLWLYGEVLGLDTMVAVVGARMPAISVLELMRSEWYGFYLSYWSVFGVFTLLASEWIHWFFHILTLIGLLGLFVSLLNTQVRFSFVSWLLILFCALTLIGVIRWTLQTPASQGRLLFGAIAPISMGLAVGWLALLGERFARVGAVSLGIALAVIALIIPIVDIAPKYAPPPVLNETQLPADLQPVSAKLSDSVELIGYTNDGAVLHAGQNARVTFYWRALEPMLTDDTLALVVSGQGANVVSKIDSWPGRGLWPTSFWTPGEIYADTFEFPLAADAVTPTLLRLRLWLWRAGPDDRLPVRMPDRSETDAVTLTIGRLTALSNLSAPPVSDGSTFEYGITLLGYDILNTLGTIHFYWQARERVPANYTLFVHLVDEQGNKLAQADGEPLNGDWPTSAWEPGQAFVDLRHINLPSDLPLDQYSFKVGWYDPVTGARLVAFKPNGEPWPDNAVVLEMPK